MTINSLKYDGNIDAFCARGGLEELVNSLDTINDGPTIRQALDIIGYCKDSLHSQRVKDCLLKNGIAKILHVLATYEAVEVKTAALLSLYIYTSKYKESQLVICKYQGIEVLTELLTLEYCDILHQILMVLQVCLSKNEQNQKIFAQVGGFQMLFSLASNVEQEKNHLEQSFYSAINSLVEVMLVCTELQDNIDTFWGEPSYSLSILSIYLAGVLCSIKVLAQYLKSDDKEMRNILETQSKIDLVVTLLSSKNFCLAKAAYGALHNWLQVSENCQKLILSESLSSLISNVNCSSNPFAQLSSARLIVDSSFAFESFGMHICRHFDHLIGRLVTIIADDTTRAQEITKLQALNKLAKEPPQSNIKDAEKAEERENEDTASKTESIEVPTITKPSESAPSSAPTLSPTLSPTPLPSPSLTPSEPIPSLQPSTYSSEESISEAPPTPDFSHIDTCETCGGFLPDENTLVERNKCECPKIISVSPPDSNNATTSASSTRFRIQKIPKLHKENNLIKVESTPCIEVEAEVEKLNQSKGTKAIPVIDLSVRKRRKRVGRPKKNKVPPTTSVPRLPKIPKTTTTLPSLSPNDPSLSPPVTILSVSPAPTLISPVPSSPPISSSACTSPPSTVTEDNLKNLMEIEKQLLNFVPTSSNSQITNNILQIKNRIERMKAILTKPRTTTPSLSAAAPKRQYKRIYTSDNSGDDANDSDFDQAIASKRGRRGKGKGLGRRSKQDTPPTDQLQPEKQQKAKSTPEGQRRKRQKKRPPDTLPKLQLNSVSQEWQRNLAEEYDQFTRENTQPNSTITSTSTSTSSSSPPPEPIFNPSPNRDPSHPCVPHFDPLPFLTPVKSEVEVEFDQRREATAENELKREVPEVEEQKREAEKRKDETEVKSEESGTDKMKESEKRQEAEETKRRRLILEEIENRLAQARLLGEEDEDTEEEELALEMKREAVEEVAQMHEEREVEQGKKTPEVREEGEVKKSQEVREVEEVTKVQEREEKEREEREQNYSNCYPVIHNPSNFTIQIGHQPEIQNLNSIHSLQPFPALRLIPNSIQLSFNQHESLATNPDTPSTPSATPSLPPALRDPFSNHTAQSIPIAALPQLRVVVRKPRKPPTQPRRRRSITPSLSDPTTSPPPSPPYPRAPPPSPILQPQPVREPTAIPQNVFTTNTQDLGEELRRLEKRVEELRLVEVREWSVGDVGTWLAFIGLSNHVRRFQYLGIDGTVLLELTDESVIETHLKIRYKNEKEVFLEEVAKLKKIKDAPEEVETENKDDDTEPELDEVMGFGFICSTGKQWLPR